MFRPFYCAILLTALLSSCNTESKPAEEKVTTESAKSETTTKKVIQTVLAPEPVGPYNQAIMVGNTLYLAGQIAIDPESGEMLTASIEVEAKRVMDNLQAVLEEAGMDMSHVVKSSIFMTDLNDFGKVNEIYGSYFGEMAPARETVQVASLPKGAHLEISMIAVK